MGTAGLPLRSHGTATQPTDISRPTAAWLVIPRRPSAAIVPPAAAAAERADAGRAGVHVFGSTEWPAAGAPGLLGSA